MVKKIISVLCLLQSTIHFLGQDVQFSQLFADRMYINPAYAGVDYCPKFVLAYRNQWPGINQPYKTFSASYDQYIAPMNGGIGIRMMKDVQGAGTFSQFNADFIYSYHVKLARRFSAKFALQASVYQKSMSTRDLVFYNMIDPVQGVINPNTEGIADEKFISPDFSVGALFNYRKYFMGISAQHVPQTIVEYHNEFLPLKLIAHAGAVIPVVKNDSKRISYVLEPNVLYIHQQNMDMLYYGIYFDINSISFGLFYRQNLDFHYDAMVASFHLNVKNLTIAYSYDITLSKFIGQTQGSHELSLIYILPCDKKIKNYNTISCPSF